MAIDWLKPMKWLAEGIAPTKELEENGFQAGYKPPASVFNYFLNREQRCIEQLQEELDKTRCEIPKIVNATSTDGVVYTATVEDVTKLYNGMQVTIIPDKRSTSRSISLNINNLGAVAVRQPLSFSTFVATAPDRDYFLYENVPCRLMYHANYTNGGIWLMADKQKTSAQDLYGTVPLDGGGTGVANENQTGAFYAEQDGDALVGKYGILPTTHGGTGAEVKQGAFYADANKKGNYGILPIAYGGTGHNWAISGALCVTETYTELASVLVEGGVYVPITDIYEGKGYYIVTVNDGELLQNLGMMYWDGKTTTVYRAPIGTVRTDIISYEKVEYYDCIFKAENGKRKFYLKNNMGRNSLTLAYKVSVRRLNTLSTISDSSIEG